VIHKEKKDNDEVLNIVDGQQRTITLTLVAYAIIQYKKEDLKKIKGLADFSTQMTNLSFLNNVSKANIQNNYKEIARRMDEFDEKTIFFFFNKCELVEVILTDISEAFQFFDSQNARGKDLEPHDLLKAFHLREMQNSSTEKERLKTVASWEAMDTEKLSKLFALYLYRIRNWSKSCSARYFTKNEVDIFKGISMEIKEDYPFAKIFRIAHYYTDNYNSSYHRNIDKNLFVFPFQIDQTIINGKRFFEMVAYYNKMIDTIKSGEYKKQYPLLNTIATYEGHYRTGDKYIHNLFYCGLIYYYDKFGEKDLSKAIDKIFIWAYTLRLKLYSVGLDSIDNYALKRNDYAKIQLFRKIREAICPNDILNIKLEILNENRSSKTEEIVELFKEMQYYEQNN
jgi:hypothetical protein